MSQVGKIRLTSAKSYSVETIAIPVNSTEITEDNILPLIFQNINAKMLI